MTERWTEGGVFKKQTPTHTFTDRHTHTGSGWSPCFLSAAGSSGLHFPISALPQWAEHQWGKTEGKKDRGWRQREKKGGEMRSWKKRGSWKAIWSYLLSEVWASSTSLLHFLPPPSLRHVVAMFSTPAEGPLAPPCLNPILDLSRHFLLLNE